MPARLEARRISKQVGDRLILADVSFTIAPGCLLALFGPNGAGKSTLLRMLALLVAPSFGTVRIDGQEAADDSSALRSRIGLLSHQGYLYEGLTAQENLDFYARLYGLPARARAERIRELLDWVGLSLFTHEPVRTYSRGMLQRLAIARTILHDPAVLLLDEPYTGLDQAARTLLDRLIEDSKRVGRTLVLVSHDAAEGLHHADQVLVLSRGRVVGSGLAADWSPARLTEILTQPGGPGRLRGGRAS